MGSALLGERQMLRLNRNVLLVLFTSVIAWTGLANGQAVSEHVSVFMATDMASIETALRETTLVLHNGSDIPIFIPTEHWRPLFVDAIQFEFRTSTREKPICVSPKEPDVRFSPTYYKLEPGCSISRTFFWHSDLSDQMYNALSEAEQVRVQWCFRYYDSNNEEHIGDAYSKWLPKEKFKYGVSRVKETIGGTLIEKELPLRQPKDFGDSTIEVILNDEL
jgi:hypothetical protein